MARTLDELRDEALTLDVEQRGALADSIWESFLTDEEREIQTAWTAEAERRLEELRSGKATAIPWEDVKARLLAKYGQLAIFDPLHHRAGRDLRHRRGPSKQASGLLEGPSLIQPS